MRNSLGGLSGWFGDEGNPKMASIHEIRGKIEGSAV
jgi:hypothetical protein